MKEKNKKIVYGKMPIRKYLKSNHFHVIVNSEDNKFVSVGLTSDKPDNKKNQKLHLVYESNGKIARLKSSATIDNKKYYHKRLASFNVDIETEKKAFILGQNKSNKKRNTNLRED